MDLDNVAGFVKFCLRVSPHMFSTRQTYIPQRVLHNFPGTVPNLIKFVVNNGDVFEGLLVASKSCFLGLRTLLRQYRTHNISYLCFEYMGRGEFAVTIFDSAAVEVDYPHKSLYVNRKEGGSERIPDVDQFKVSEVYTLQDHLNNNLLTLNASDCHDRKIYVYMENQSHLQHEEYAAIPNLDDQGNVILWDDGSTVFFEASKKCWRIIVRKKHDKWCFCDGWKQFVKDVSARENDVVVLFESSSTSCFDVSIYRDYATTPFCIEQQLEAPPSFIKMATFDMIAKGQLVVPRLFLSKYQHQFDNEITIEGPHGSLHFHIRFEEGCKLSGLEDLIVGSYLRVGYTMVFTKHSPSRLSVSVYDDQLIDIGTT